MWRDAAEGLRLIGRTPRLCAIIAVTWVGTLFGTAPEGIAAPLVTQLGQGPTQIGVLLAANPAGVTVGGLLIARALTQQRREQLVPGLVVLSLVPILSPGWSPVGRTGPGRLRRRRRAAVRRRPRGVLDHPAQRRLRAGGAVGLPRPRLRGRGQRAVRRPGHRRAGRRRRGEGIAPGGVVAAVGGLGLLAVVPPLLGYVRTQGHVAPASPPAGRSVT
jgi:hypothetical protein